MSSRAASVRPRHQLSNARTGLSVVDGSPKTISASIALVLGTLCGVALTRFRRFRGKTLLAGLVSAPLVMPDVITGLSLLLLFVAMESLIGWPAGRSELTIILAHSTFCMSYVTVVVRSRLADLDLSLEEAAVAPEPAQAPRKRKGSAG